MSDHYIAFIDGAFAAYQNKDFSSVGLYLGSAESFCQKSQLVEIQQ